MKMTRKNSLRYSGAGLSIGVLPEGRSVNKIEYPIEDAILKPERASYNIPRLGGALKFLVDPARQFNHNAPSHEVLGANLVVNGDFSDYTMPDDANTVGHWIFDPYYNLMNSGSGYALQNWVGTSNWGANLISTSSPDACHFTDNAVSWYTAVRCSLSWNSTGQYMTATVTDAAGEISFYRPSLFTVGKMYRVRFRARSNSVTLPFYWLDGYYKHGVIKNPNLSPEWQEYEFISYTNYTLCRIVLFAGAQVTNGATIDFDDIEAYEFSGQYPMIASGYANTYDSAFVQNSPVYRDGYTACFNGVVGQSLNIPGAYATTLSPRTGDWTVEMWVYFNSLPSTGYVIIACHSTAAGPGSMNWTISVYNTGLVKVYVGDGSGTPWVNLFSVSALTVGQWYHIAAVLDRDGDQSIYINGVRDSYQTVTNTVDLQMTTSLPYSVGSVLFGVIWQYVLNGYIAEVRHSNVARTDQEIFESYGLAKYWLGGNNPDGLVKTLGEQCWSERSGESSGYIYQNVTLEPGELYKVQMDCKVGSAGINYAIYFDGSYLRPAIAMTYTDYEHLIYYCRAVNVSTYIGFYVYVSTKGYVKNVSVQKVLNANVKTYSKMIVDYSRGGAMLDDTELVLNQSFTTNTANWGVSGTGTITRVTSDYVSSPACGEASTNTNTNYVFATLSKTLTAGRNYKVCFWAKSISGATDLNVFNALNQMTVTLTTSWQYYEITNYANASNSLRFATGSGAGVWRIDDLTVREFGNGYHGYLLNGLTLTMCKQHTAAIYFNGVNQYVGFPGVPNLLDRDFIVFAWANRNTLTGNDDIIAKWGTPYKSFVLYGASSPVRWTWEESVDGSATSYQQRVSENHTQHVWQFITVVRQGNVREMFINGVEKKPYLTFGTPVNVLYNTSINLSVGGNVSYCDGKIGICGIYIFDGQNGAPAKLPNGYRNLIRYIYNQTKHLYHYKEGY